MKAVEKAQAEKLGLGAKIVFIGKLVIFIISFGFVFPLLLTD
jgi:hypothetical protein